MTQTTLLLEYEALVQQHQRQFAPQVADLYTEIHERLHQLQQAEQALVAAQSQQLAQIRTQLATDARVLLPTLELQRFVAEVQTTAPRQRYGNPDWSHEPDSNPLRWQLAQTDLTVSIRNYELIVDHDAYDDERTHTIYGYRVQVSIQQQVQPVEVQTRRVYSAIEERRDTLRQQLEYGFESELAGLLKALPFELAQQQQLSSRLSCCCCSIAHAHARTSAVTVSDRGQRMNELWISLSTYGGVTTRTALDVLWRAGIQRLELAIGVKPTPDTVSVLQHYGQLGMQYRAHHAIVWEEHRPFNLADEFDSEYFERLTDWLAAMQITAYSVHAGRIDTSAPAMGIDRFLGNLAQLAQLVAFFRGPEGMESLAQLRDWMLKEFRLMLIEWEIGVAIDAIHPIARKLIIERFRQPPIAMLEQLPQLFEQVRDSRTDQSEATVAAARAANREVRRIMVQTLTEEDWQALIQSATSTLEQHLHDKRTQLSVEETTNDAGADC